MGVARKKVPVVLTPPPSESPADQDRIVSPTARFDRVRVTRQRVRATPGVSHAYRVMVFLVGLALILTGFAAIVLPGPLTIPPVLLGLWVWSTEFHWAHRFLNPYKKKASEAWVLAKAHPWRAGVISGLGLVGAGIAVWVMVHYNLLDKVGAWLLMVWKGWWNGS